MKVLPCLPVSSGRGTVFIPLDILAGRDLDYHAVHVILISYVVTDEITLPLREKSIVAAYCGSQFIGGYSGKACAAVRLYLVDQVCNFYCCDLQSQSF